METYKIYYEIEGVTYFFVSEFTIPKNDPKNIIVFLAAIDNDKEKKLLKGKVTEWDYELLHTK